MKKALGFAHVMMLALVLGLVALVSPARADIAAFFTEVTSLTTTLSTNISTVMIAVLGIVGIYVGFKAAKKAMRSM